jgi:DNA-binding winged helix-turn-helix (wHTH) protein/tetratricopeptide (TPR) repeat protein/TolB-like protein
MQGTESCPQSRRFGVFEVDLRTAELRKRGIRIKLQEQPFQILSLLLEHPGEVVTREELRQKLWPAHTFVDFDRSLNKAMTKLRSALGDSAESPRYVETIPRHGYRFLAPVHAQQEEGLLSANKQAPENGHSGLHTGNGSNGHSGNSAHIPSPSPQARERTFFARIGHRRFFGVAAALVLFLVGTGAYVRTRPPVLGGSTVSPRLSVAVLGFKNLSGEAQEAWLSTALSDWLMTELTAGEQLRAIPAESVARMKMELPLPDVDSLGAESLVRIRKNLGTDFVVVGSYAKLGESPDGPIRVDLRLQDTRSGETIGAISEVGTEAHMLDLVSRAGQHLREKLGVRAVTREEAAEVAIALPSKPEAAKPYSEGLAKLRIFDSLAARDLLQKAVAAEPDFALSHAGLATAWAQLGYDENARAEAKKAFDYSRNLPRAERLLVEGRYREMSRDWGRAIEIYRALFDFFPDNLDYGLALANAQYYANRWKDGLDTTAALRQLPTPLRDDPRIDLAETDAARSLGDSNRAQAAIARAAEKARAAGASLLLARARREQAWLFENSGQQDQVEGAIREAKQLYLAANDRQGVAAAATLEAIALERQGDYLEAKKKYEESLGIYRVSGNKLSVANEYDNLGDILLYLGDLAGARRSYGEALAIYHELGDQNGTALAKLGLGDVFLAQGEHAEAKGVYEEALDICRQLGNRSREASALADLAELQRLGGDADAARKNEAAAIVDFESAGDKSEAEHVRLQTAALLLDEGKSAEAGALAEHAIAVFDETRAGRYAAQTKLLIAEARLAQGRNSEAKKNVDEVLASAKGSHNQELELRAVILGARVQAVSGNARDVSESKRQLNRAITDAAAGGFGDVAFEARLALGQIELDSGNLAAGRARLEALQKDSTNAGLLMIARKASVSLRGVSHQAAN